jgi:hypothetical protein
MPLESYAGDQVCDESCQAAGSSMLRRTSCNGVGCLSVQAAAKFAWFMTHLVACKPVSCVLMAKHCLPGCCSTNHPSETEPSLDVHVAHIPCVCLKSSQTP